MKKIFEKILEFVFPVKCVGCGKNEKYLCADCATSVPPPPAISYLGPKISAYCAAPYRHPTIKKLIRGLKYRAAFSVADTLADLLYSQTVSVLDILVRENAIIIPVPVSDKRKRERGLNQAEILAKCLSDKTGLCLTADALLKISHTPPQAGISSRKDRLKNLRGSFAIKNPEKIKNKTVILVDDVITTGATIIECSRVLEKAGCREIIALVVAH